MQVEDKIETDGSVCQNQVVDIKNPDSERERGAAFSLIMSDNDDDSSDGTAPAAEIRPSCLTRTLPSPAGNNRFAQSVETFNRL